MILVSDYLTAMSEAQLEPHFYTTREYFRKAGVKVTMRDDAMVPMVAGAAIAPPIREGQFVSVPEVEIWCVDEEQGMDASSFAVDFNDFSYVYDPHSFKDLFGKKWKPLRKILNTFHYPLDKCVYAPLGNPQAEDVISGELLLAWLQDRENEIISDPEVLQLYCLAGEHRKFLFSPDEETGRWVFIGMNIWDESWKYIHYRYVIYNPRFKNSSWIMRYAFYNDPVIVQSGKLVLDGGTLGNAGLKFHKDRLNPVKVKKTYTWRYVK